MDTQAAKELDYGISNAVGALIEAMGMQAENLMRTHRGQPPGYPESAFQELMLSRGLHHNAILKRWEGIP
jgi:hypothetical protein